MHVLQNHNTKALINPEGAELQSLVHNGTELMYQKEEGFWQRCSPILFPIVGKLNNNSYLFEGKSYQMSQHGFARDCKFICLEQNDAKVTFRLESSEATLKLYPFPFMLDVSYQLVETGLKVKYRVKATGGELYYSIGAHPAFQLHGALEDYEIRFDKDLEVPVQGLVDGQRMGLSKKLNLKCLKLSENLFECDTLIFKDLESKSVEVFQNGLRCFGMSFSAPYFGIWRQKGSPFICLEPWWGVADDAKSGGEFSEKEGIQMLKRGESQAHEYKVIF